MEGRRRGSICYLLLFLNIFSSRYTQFVGNLCFLIYGKSASISPGICFLIGGEPVHDTGTRFLPVTEKTSFPRQSTATVYQELITYNRNLSRGDR